MANAKLFEARLEELKGRFSEQAKKAEKRINEIKEKISQLDSASSQAKSRLDKLRKTGLGEMNRLKTVLQSEVTRFYGELHKSSEKLKTQFKEMTTAERAKRRGRSRSRRA
jgi:hypothetical protein